MTKDTWVKIGTVGRPWGLQGYFYVSGRDAQIPKQYGKILIGENPDRGEEFEIYSSKLQSGRPVLKLKSINRREHLEQWMGQPIWVKRAAIRVREEEEYLWPDLIGKALVDNKGELVGIIKDVMNHGASDIIAVHDDAGRTLDIPFIKSFVDLSFRSEDAAIHLIVNKATFDDLWTKPKVPIKP